MKTKYKIKPEKLQDLLNLGFEVVNQQEAVKRHDYLLSLFKMVYRLDGSRRGQVYYLGVYDKNEYEKNCENELKIFATEPDGDGGCISFNEIFFTLIEQNFIEKT